jgi:menaquinone-9 beta-reductase
MTYDVLIVGGGPAGATAGVLLARAGWSVAVVEKKEFPRRKVCGEFVSATTVQTLRTLGLDENFLVQAGPPVRRVGLYAGDLTLSAPMPPAKNVPAQWGRALGREHLDTLLLEAAAKAGAEILQPWTAKAIGHIDGGHWCAVEAGKRGMTLSARLLLAANGSWEPGVLPEQAPPAHRSSDLLAFKAHFHNAALPRDLMPLLIFPGGYGGMVHSDGGRVSLSCCIRRDALQRCRRIYPAPHAGDSVLAHIRASCRGVDEALAAANPDGVVLAAGPIQPGIRPRYANGIFFTGNAAGEAHPIIAEGISMAIQSAWLLSRRLLARESDTRSAAGIDGIGRAYAADWRRVFAPRLYAAAIFAQLAQHSPATLPLWRAVRWFPRILTLGARLSGKAWTLAPAA